MSRIGRKPIPLPSGVGVEIEGRRISVIGPKGSLSLEVHPRMTVKIQDGSLQVVRPSDVRQDRALHGLTRTLLANVVEGVSRGFEKRLELFGVGYRAQVDKGALVLHLGYSHPIRYPIPSGVSIRVEGTGVIVISGIDKQQIGQVAATIRSFRPPDPYKGKGIRYVGEVIRLKPGKTGAKG